MLALLRRRGFDGEQIVTGMRLMKRNRELDLALRRAFEQRGVFGMAPRPAEPAIRKASMPTAVAQ